MSRSTNAAILFAPLRVVPIYEGAAFEIHTKQDDTPGSKNNFVLCLCQQKEEADLFAAAPEMLLALNIARLALDPDASVAEIGHWGREDAGRALKVIVLAIAKAKGGAS